jgi:ParB-like chromosome segregation protein Spo0J
MHIPVTQPFLPHTRVPLVAARVPLAALPADADLECDPPGAALVADIRAVGILQPVILMTRVDGSYVVCDGRGRIRAARAAGLDAVPAMVAPEGHIAPSAVGAKANALRRDNPRTRLTFIEEATAAGLDDRTVCRVGGFGAAELKAARRLLGLVPHLRAALDAGTIRAAVAQEAAALEPAQQETLVAALALTGRLAVGDVRAARRVVRDAAVAELPPLLFETPAAAAAGDWRTDAGRLLHQVLALVPVTEPAARAAVAAAIAAIASPTATAENNAGAS